jgi:23S rRNA pseudouridine2605 synthase
VYDFIREPDGERLVYVGRLDRDTEGLLILTTHGALAHRLMHPRWEIEREYRVETSGPLDEGRLARAAKRGIDLEDERAGPFRARVLDRSGERRTLELVLTEGKKREVRRIVEACGGRVERLVRTRFAFLTLAGLESGRWRRLDREEMGRLLALVDLSADQTSRQGGGGAWT